MANKKYTNWIIMGCILAVIIFGLVYGDMGDYFGAFRVTGDAGNIGAGNVIQVVP